MVTIRKSSTSIEVVSSALIYNASSPHVIVIAISNFISSDFVLSEDWSDVEGTILNERGGSIIVI
mgnify:FL=1